MVTTISSVIFCLTKIFIDFCMSWYSTTLPVVQKKIINPGFLNYLLLEYGTSSRFRKAEIKNITQLDIQVPSSNCNNTILKIDWVNPTQMPSTIFVKASGAAFATRWFCNVIGVWELECNFIRNFYEDFPVRLPEVYAVVNKRSRFVLLQENLQEDSSVELFTNGDMVNGCSLDVAENCLAALAQMHARFNNLSRDEQEKKLTFSSHPFLSSKIAPITYSINMAAIDLCCKRFPGHFSEAVTEMYFKAMQHWAELLTWWYQGQLTLIHGDSHLGNIFLYGKKVGLLDFQAAQWGKGVRDVQYFLINSLPESVLIDNEQKLLNYYLERLAANGMDLSFDVAWEQYRAYSFQTLMTNAVSIGLGALTEKDQVIEVLLGRSISACERLDFKSWLDDIIK